MHDPAADIDLTPPPFEEGLCLWSQADGTPDTPAYDDAQNVRLARGDPDFGTCLELRKIEPVQRLRYMGEAPMPAGAFVEVSARLKHLRGPALSVRVAAWPGGRHGRGVAGLDCAAPEIALDPDGAVTRVSAVIGPVADPGVDLVWTPEVLYAHVGLDLIGPDGGVVRIENLAVRNVTPRFSAVGRILPGFLPLAAR